MFFDETTTLRVCGYRDLLKARVIRNLGCLIAWKPSIFCVGAEIWKGGFGLFLGPLMIGCGKIWEDESWSYLPDHLRKPN